MSSKCKGLEPNSVNLECKDNKVYFQPPGIKAEYCEVGIFYEKDPDYIWYLSEPCKILISEVKIIPKEKVFYDKKNRFYKVKKD